MILFWDIPLVQLSIRCPILSTLDDSYDDSKGFIEELDLESYLLPTGSPALDDTEDWKYHLIDV